MTNQVLKDAKGRRLAEITTDSSGKQTIKDSRGRRLGEYNPDTNTTVDSKGRKVGTGNLLASLINE